MPLAPLHILAIIALTATAYHGVGNHQFVWDTIPMVLENPWIHDWTLNNVISMFTEAHRANWQPMVLLSHAIDISIFGYDPAPHHWVNVALHSINACLVYWLVFQLAIQAKHSVRPAQWIAFLTALIFAIHPQHVESVAWIVERKDVLYSLFALLCLLTYTRAEKNTCKFGVMAFIFFSLSVAAKPMAVTLPAILVLLDIYPGHRVNNIRELCIACLTKLHYWVISLVVIAVTLTTQSMAMPTAESLPLWVRTLNAIDNSLFYLLHYLWPVNLSPFYPYPTDIETITTPGFWLPGLCFLLASILGSLFLLTQQIRWPFVLFAIYLVTLLPVSGLIHVGPAKATDHYVYLATIPFSLLTALAIVAAFIRLKDLRIAIGLSAAVYLGFLMAITLPQVTVWQNHLNLWGSVLQHYPDSAFAHRNMAAAFVEVNEWDKALFHAEQSLKLGSPDTAYVESLRQEILNNHQR